MFRFDTEWAYKHMVIIVAVHKMNFQAECGIKIAKDGFLKKSWEKTGEYSHINLEQVIFHI